jgi:3-oxoadipate enol-lactonase
VSAVAVSYTEDGPADAPVVLLSNSLGSTRSMWDAQVPALAERYRVITYDGRGHGKSPVPPAPYTLDDLVDDAVALLDEVGAARAHLVGLSLGGMTFLRLAARHPERVHRLVVMCTSAYYGTPESWLDRAHRSRTEGTGALAPAVVSKWFTPGFAARRPDVVAAAEAMLAGIDDEGYAASCGVLAELDLRADLPLISAPTLVVSGAQDLAAPPEHQRAIADGIPGAAFRSLDDAAHIAAIEQPLQVTGAILGHLDAAEDAR